MLIAALAGLFLAAGLAVFAFLEQMQERATVRSTLRQLGEYDVAASANTRDQELLNPFRQRALKPFTQSLTGLGRRFTPVGYVDGVREKLIYVGRPGPEELDRFLAIRVLTVAAVPLWILFDIFFVDLQGTGGLAVFFLVPALLVMGPDAMLNRQVEERQYLIRRTLPDILDLLVISVEAGLGFEQALDRVVAAVPGPLSEEFGRMLGETRAGSSRADALRSLDDRTGVSEVRSFVLAILQADTFGVSIGRVLRAQADEMRIRRRQLAQEEAQKAPVKMMIPMVFCIFPSLFVVVLAPAVINIVNTF